MSYSSRLCCLPWIMPARNMSVGSSRDRMRMSTTTRSPGLIFVASGPTATTRPTNEDPVVSGMGKGYLCACREVVSRYLSAGGWYCYEAIVLPLAIVDVPDVADDVGSKDTHDGTPKSRLWRRYSLNSWRLVCRVEHQGFHGLWEGGR